MKNTTSDKASQSIGIFSTNLFSELSSILTDEFGRRIADTAELQEIGIRIIEFVIAKERNNKCPH